MPFKNNIIENVVAGVIVAAIIWLTTRLWTHWHRKESGD